MYGKKLGEEKEHHQSTTITTTTTTTTNNNEIAQWKKDGTLCSFPWLAIAFKFSTSLFYRSLLSYSLINLLFSFSFPLLLLSLMPSFCCVSGGVFIIIFIFLYYCCCSTHWRTLIEPQSNGRKVLLVCHASVSCGSKALLSLDLRANFYFLATAIFGDSLVGLWLFFLFQRVT